MAVLQSQQRLHPQHRPQYPSGPADPPAPHHVLEGVHHKQDMRLRNGAPHHFGHLIQASTRLGLPCGSHSQQSVAHRYRLGVDDFDAALLLHHILGQQRRVVDAAFLRSQVYGDDFVGFLSEFAVDVGEVLGRGHRRGREDPIQADPVVELILAHVHSIAVALLPKHHIDRHHRDIQLSQDCERDVRSTVSYHSDSHATPVGLCEQSRRGSLFICQ